MNTASVSVFSIRENLETFFVFDRIINILLMLIIDLNSIQILNEYLEMKILINH
jgi:hypothetical protein